MKNAYLSIVNIHKNYYYYHHHHHILVVGSRDSMAGVRIQKGARDFCSSLKSQLFLLAHPNF
jgi:hypothetical protein